MPLMMCQWVRKDLRESLLEVNAGLARTLNNMVNGGRREPQRACVIVYTPIAFIRCAVVKDTEYVQRHAVAHVVAMHSAANESKELAALLGHSNQEFDMI